MVAACVCFSQFLSPGTYPKSYRPHTQTLQAKTRTMASSTSPRTRSAAAAARGQAPSAGGVVDVRVHVFRLRSPAAGLAAIRERLDREGGDPVWTGWGRVKDVARAFKASRDGGPEFNRQGLVQGNACRVMKIQDAYKHISLLGPQQCTP